MSIQTKARLEMLALVVGLFLSISGALKAWVLLPDKLANAEERMAAAEMKLVAVQAQRQSDWEVILRMSWNYEQVTKDIASINKKLDAKP